MNTIVSVISYLNVAKYIQFLDFVEDNDDVQKRLVLPAASGAAGRKLFDILDTSKYLFSYYVVMTLKNGACATWKVVWYLLMCQIRALWQANCCLGYHSKYINILCYLNLSFCKIIRICEISLRVFAEKRKQGWKQRLLEPSLRQSLQTQHDNLPTLLSFYPRRLVRSAYCLRSLASHRIIVYHIIFPPSIEGGNRGDIGFWIS